MYLLRKLSIASLVCFIFCAGLFLGALWGENILKLRSGFGTSRLEIQLGSGDQQDVGASGATPATGSTSSTTADASSGSDTRGEGAAHPDSDAVGVALSTGAAPAKEEQGPAAQTAAADDGRVPHIIHHMHADLSRLSEHDARLRKRCQELHPNWQFMFWNDTAMDDFVKTHFAWYYSTWIGINPPIKRIDTSRYMLMHHFGGVYLDSDVECVRALDSLVDPLPTHAAWVGDFPEPMFLASSARAEFWLYTLERISKVWNTTNAWQSTGPAGLNLAFRDWVEKHGSGCLVPYVTQRTEPEFHEYIKNKNNTVPWFELSDRNYFLRNDSSGGGDLPALWISATGRGKEGRPGLGANGPFFPHSRPQDVPPTKRVGFLANELLDPPGCGAAELEPCRQAWCAAKWPQAYVVHHCMNTWRGRIGDTRRRLRRGRQLRGAGSGQVEAEEGR